MNSPRHEEPAAAPTSCGCMHYCDARYDELIAADDLADRLDAITALLEDIRDLVATGVKLTSIYWPQGTTTK